MVDQDLLLFPVFERLCRQGIPLDTSDYHAAIEVMQSRVGSKDITNFKGLFRLLWTKSREDLELFDIAFAELVEPYLPLTFASTPGVNSLNKANSSSVPPNTSIITSKVKKQPNPNLETKQELKQSFLGNRKSTYFPEEIVSNSRKDESEVDNWQLVPANLEEVSMLSPLPSMTPDARGETIIPQIPSSYGRQKDECSQSLPEKLVFHQRFPYQNTNYQTKQSEVHRKYSPSLINSIKKQVNYKLRPQLPIKKPDLDATTNQPLDSPQKASFSEEALQEVLAFERRFGSKHLLLACHASFPLIITPEIINLIHVNFLCEQQIPWVAETDFLLSPLCRPIDDGLFEVEPLVRDILLVELENQFGWQRLLRLARFLLTYLHNTPDWKQQPEVKRVQAWIAQAYLNPGDLSKRITDSVKDNLLDTDTLLGLPGQIQLVKLLELIAELLELSSQQTDYKYPPQSRAIAQKLHTDKNKLREEIKQESAEDETEMLKEEKVLLSPLNLEQLTASDLSQLKTKAALIQDFHISVTPLGDDEYLVRTEGYTPGVPSAQEIVSWPVDDWFTQARQLMNDPLLGLLQGNIAFFGDTCFWPEVENQVTTSSLNLVALGKQLYNALFQGSLRDSWIMAQAIAQNKHLVLRLRLGLKGTRLSSLPWEVLHVGDHPLATGSDFTFSRYQVGTRLMRPLKTSPSKTDQPLKILMVIAGPSDQESLELLEEASQLQEELRSRSSNEPPAIELTILEQPGREQLTQALEQEKYQVFHYAGHSKMGESGGDVYLVSHKTGLTETLNGDDLAGLLVNNGVQLAVFNSCYGAYSVTSDAQENSLERNLAQAVVKRGIPGVLAMAERIPDEVALTLTRLLYRNLNQGYPIDLSLSRSRQGLISAYGSNQFYWALPVLYLHPEFDGFLTNVKGVREEWADMFALPKPQETTIAPNRKEAPLRATSTTLSDSLNTEDESALSSITEWEKYEDDALNFFVDSLNLEATDADFMADELIDDDFIRDLLSELNPEPNNSESLNPEAHLENGFS